MSAPVEVSRRQGQALYSESTIAKNRNTYAKRQREQDKKQRADDKRTKRVDKKEKPESTPQTVPREEY
ncbi:MAG: hypothetical protein Q8K78_05210 [Planctomycetaceae bacterium]|jgi:hypothetical protein|nr:hypothetical protein [Planctomycetaceae bacterium]